MLKKVSDKLRFIVFFIYTSFVLEFLFLLFRYQRSKFYIFVLAGSLLAYLLLVSPLTATQLLIFVSQSMPFNLSFTILGKHIRIVETVAMFSVPIWVSLYVVNPSSSFKRRFKFGFLEFFLIVFVIVFLINVVRGVQAGYHINEKSRWFRFDVFRGPVYYVFYFYFLKILKSYKDSVFALVKTWYVSVIVGVLFYFVLSFKNYASGYTLSFWGFNVQLFSFFGGWLLALWLFDRKSLYFAGFVIWAVLISFLASRTVIIGGAFMVLFVSFIWLLYFEKHKLRFITNFLMVALALGVVVLMYYLFLSNSMEHRVLSIFLKNKQLLHLKYIRYFPSIQARIVESCNVIYNWKNGNKWIGAPFGEIISMFAGINIVDVFYTNLLGKMGIIGLVSFLGFMGSFFRRAFVVMRDLDVFEQSEIKAFVVMSVAMIPTALIMAITMNHLWFTPGTILTIVFSAAVITILWNQVKENI